MSAHKTSGLFKGMAAGLTAAAIIAIILSAGSSVSHYLYALFSSTTRLFCMLLSSVFILGMHVLFDRVAFFLCHSVFTRRLPLSPIALEDSAGDTSRETTYHVFLKNAREFRARSAEGLYSEDIVSRARQAALRETLDGQELDWGRGWLEFLGVVAPTLGFAGTLVGLIDSFQELGMGGDIMDVLDGLALSMTTSLMGAIISLLFLSAAWLLGRARDAFDDRLANLIAHAQQVHQYS